MSNISLRKKIRDTRASTGIGWDIIEQDYVLSWVLFGLSRVEKLRESLIFKGGTALKKCYFGNYRFSQDLDFSVRGDYPRGDELLSFIQRACILAEENAENIAFVCKRHSETGLHPEEQEAFDIRARLPWHRDFSTSIKVEVTTREFILLEPAERPILHEYGEELNSSIFVYKIEEIIAEKIRAILQFSKKLHERGWSRSRVRDYYDLWRILHEYGEMIDIHSLPELIKKKCETKGVMLHSVDDLFQSRLMEYLEEWHHWLDPIVPQVPDRDIVINELKQQLRRICEEPS
jgi:predicted nucleotidyltransferase component of viral defense system